jgi:hypothetical protein
MSGGMRKTTAIAHVAKSMVFWQISARLESGNINLLLNRNTNESRCNICVQNVGQL